jgi:hypothetical protein
MSYLVIAHETTGGPTYAEVDDLDEAARMVEQLRNDAGVEHARICRLEEVPFEFRPYFRVEVRDAVGIPRAPEPESSAADEWEDSSADDEASAVGPAGVTHVHVDHHRRGLFGR